MFETPKPKGLTRYVNERVRSYTAENETISYPGFISLAFQNGRTSRAKYNAKPSRRPL